MDLHNGTQTVPARQNLHEQVLGKSVEHVEWDLNMIIIDVVHFISSE